MQVSKLLCFAASWIFVGAQYTYDDDANPETQNYQFRYYVRDESTGDIKSQEETKQGRTVNGHYSVGEPNGDLRVVTYTADDGGFRANVKYEEGGSPASEDKARQTNSKSGVEFNWLPANPDDIQEGKTGTEDNDKEDTSDGSSEGNQSTTETTTPNTSDQPSESNSEATTENTSSTETSSEPSSTEGSDIDIEIEKLSKESESSSETFSTESSSSTNSEMSPSSSESTTASADSAAENSMETSTMSSIEGKNTVETDDENKPSSENEESAEAAESAPLSEEVLPPLQPSQMYLPVISYQNIPFLNLPMLENTQGYSEKPPTIIYASQNFFNPWQWFGNSRRIARDVQHIDQHLSTSAKGFQYPETPTPPINTPTP